MHSHDWKVLEGEVPGHPWVKYPWSAHKDFPNFQSEHPKPQVIILSFTPWWKKNPNNLAFSSLLLPVKQLQSEVRSAHVLTEELWNGTVNGNSEEIAFQKKSLKYLQWKELCHNCKHVRSMFFTELCWMLLTLLSSNWVNCLFLKDAVRNLRRPNLLQKLFKLRCNQFKYKPWQLQKQFMCTDFVYNLTCN